MAAETPILRLAGGELVANPTALVSPYGTGTLLGTIHAYSLVPVVRSAEVEAEEYGGEAVKEIYMGERWVLSAALRNWDFDALAEIFKNVAAGGGGDPVITYPGTTRAVGDDMLDTSTKLYLAPRDAADPGVMLYQAVARPDASSPMIFSSRAPLVVQATWVGYRDPTRVVRIARAADQAL